jgi:hypothetical protein
MLDSCCICGNAKRVHTLHIIRHVLREKRTSIIHSVSANHFFSRSWKLKLTCVSLYGMDDATWRGRIVNGFKEGDEKNEGG